MYMAAFIATTICAGLAQDAGHTGLAVALAVLSVGNALRFLFTPPELR